MIICALEFVRESGELFIHRCPQCSSEVLSKYRKPALRRQKCGAKRRHGGPGTELRGVFAELGITPTGGCKCKAYARQMDRWGADGCRARHAEIVAHLQENAKAFGLAELAAAGWAALWQGKPLTLGGLVGLAVERAGAVS